MSDSEDLGQLKQQVIGLDRGYTELRREFRILDEKMDTKFEDSDRKMNEGFKNITVLLDRKSTPQWPAYTLIATVLIAIGGALYYPIKMDSARLDEKSEATRLELNKTQKELDFLRGQLHPLPK